MKLEEDIRPTLLWKNKLVCGLTSDMPPPDKNIIMELQTCKLSQE
jgi:hypothetical protein